ncbi:MAG: cation:proton antiporter [Nanoarchaeota archaeon]|nr:cation:proton antiporter [Nanoarchaeota archaeon]
MVEIISSFVMLIPENFKILFEIGMMMIAAGLLAFIFKVFKQPQIPAYIVAGIILGPLMLGIVSNSEVIMALSEIGIAFLLFFAGMEINFKKLKEVGKISTITGLGEMIIVGGITVGIILGLGFKNMEIIYATIVVAFSSTMVVIKLLSDKHHLNTLHGRIIVGILLVQDILAIIILTVLATNLSVNTILISLATAGGFAIIVLILAKLSEPIFKSSAKSSELIFIVAIAFLFVFVISAYFMKLSIIIGSFFAGVALANSTFKTEIKGRIHPLSDFFGAILFVSLGMQLVWISKEYLLMFFILLALILIIKPLIIFLIVRLLGYTNRTAFLTGNALGQSSEFALIILIAGLISSQISQEIFSVLVFVIIITMSLTSYFIKYESQLYKLHSKPARIFDRIPTRKEKLDYGLKNKKKIVIIGCHRMGSLILKKLKNKKEEVLVIDNNPEIIRALIDKKIPSLYGDFGNPDVAEKLSFIAPEILISTIPDLEDNLHLLNKIKQISKQTLVIVVASRIDGALELYKNGADYVILPKIIGGGKIIEMTNKLKKEKGRLKRKEIGFLNELHYFLYKD